VTEVQLVTFSWDAPEREEAKAIRFTVFVDEQGVPADLEMDEIDATATHVLARDGDGRPVGTGRMFADAKDPSCAHIGRMAVLWEARGAGIGGGILRKFISEARRLGYRRAVLSSQVHAIPFYERHGFRPFGPEYPDAGIPHRDMELELS